MIPIRSESGSGSAVITWAFAGILAIIAVIQVSLPADSMDLFRSYGLVPARFTSYESWELLGASGQLIPLFSYACIHDGLTHALLNIWFLLVFGGPVEKRLGRFRYGLSILVLTLAAGLVDVGARTASLIPLVGASGLVAGVMGIYLIAYPRGRILAIVPLAIPFLYRPPAAVFIGAWLGLQLLLAYGSSTLDHTVAWWSHLGGFGLGLILGRLILPRPTKSIHGTEERLVDTSMTQVTHE